MPIRYVFADESGCFTFKRTGHASRYFMLCTVSLDACDVGYELLGLRRHLIHHRQFDGDAFHATADRQVVRDEVFNVLRQHDFRVDATILEKSKAQPQIRTDEPTFYKYAWFYHLRHVGPKIAASGHELAITAAAIKTNRGKAHFKSAVNDVAQQVMRNTSWSVAFPPAAADPCLQVADYCAWAIQRKWERGDDRSYRLISDKVQTEFDLWASGPIHYY